MFQLSRWRYCKGPMGSDSDLGTIKKCHNCFDWIFPQIFNVSSGFLMKCLEPSRDKTLKYVGIVVPQVWTKLFRNKFSLYVFLQLLDPTWASVNKGILLCTQCCSIHRSLGRHITQVKSLLKTTWNPNQLNVSPPSAPIWLD